MEAGSRASVVPNRGQLLVRHAGIKKLAFRVVPLLNKIL